eukprot:gb/GEZN01006020.1/.p1 GENE.gb/GEZN01006020.1/~~gb/GEZN01006020.1/.p1  ORF type:complete len:448 (-),score=47.62 gb/GEZN01006020.1/:268-1611(-)
MSSAPMISPSPERAAAEKKHRERKQKPKGTNQGGGFLSNFFCFRDYWSKHPLLKWFFPLCVVMLVAAIYGVFLFDTIFPQLNGAYGYDYRLPWTHSRLTLPTWQASDTQVLVFMIFFHLFLSLFFVCFLRAIFTEPGSIPKTNRWRDGDFEDIHEDDVLKLHEIYDQAGVDHIGNLEIRTFLKMFPLVERKFGKNNERAKNGVRECKFCHLSKPDRTHHCRICNNCVLRMDHHCPWIANCVGFRNYKFFLLLLFYAVLCLIFTLVAQLPRIIRGFRPVGGQKLDLNKWVQNELLVFLTYVVAFVLTVSLLIFLGWHLQLAASSLTTIECKEKKQLYQEPEVVARHNISHVKFDYGTFSNLEHVLGPFWMWLLPLMPPPYVRNPRGKGDILQRSGVNVIEEEPGCYYQSPKKRRIWPENGTQNRQSGSRPAEKSKQVLLFLAPGSDSS